MGPVGLQAKFSEHLADLGIEALTGDEQHGETTPPGQLPVTGKEHPILGAGQPHQLMVVQIRIKVRIVTQNT